MPLKKDKKIAKRPVKKPIKKTIKQKQSQRQSIVVNVHAGSSASKRKSSSKASGSSKVERVVPMPNYQASESPYPSYMKQSVAVPVEAGNPVFASVANPFTVGPIQNRIPIFADIPKQPSTMTEEEPIMRIPAIQPLMSQTSVSKITTQPQLKPTTIPDEEVFIPPPMPEEIPKKKTVRIGKTITVKLPNPPLENIPISNVGIESESGIANVFTPVQEPAMLKSGGAFSAIFSSVDRKTPVGSRKDLQERYFMKTGSRWADVPRGRKRAADTDELRGIVKDLEAGVAR